MSRATSVPSTRESPYDATYCHWRIEPFLSRIAVSPHGDCYASGGEDGFVRVHHFDESYFRAKPHGDVRA